MKAGIRGHSNVVFVGFDKDGKARFGCLRGIGEGRFHGDLSGSDKLIPLSCPPGVENRRYTCVNPPLMSCPMPPSASWMASTGGGNLLSLAGIYVALTPGFETIYLHLDNDGKAIMTVIRRIRRVNEKPSAATGRT